MDLGSITRSSTLRFLLAATVMVGLTAGCSKEKSNGPLPQQIQGVKLQREISGEEAARMIARLHGKEVAPLQSYIGAYHDGPRHIMLYVSVFESEDQAQSLLAAMSKRIGQGSSGFGHHVRFRVRDREIHMVLGQGQVHYFYVKGQSVYWLGLPPDLAPAGLAELLGVGVNEIPAASGPPSEP